MQKNVRKRGGIDLLSWTSIARHSGMRVQHRYCHRGVIPPGYDVVWMVFRGRCPRLTILLSFCDVHRLLALIDLSSCDADGVGAQFRLDDLGEGSGEIGVGEFVDGVVDEVVEAFGL